jgi:hypothetical protein
MDTPKLKKELATKQVASVWQRRLLIEKFGHIDETLFL